MTVETVTGSTAPASLERVLIRGRPARARRPRSGGAHCEANGVAVLAVANDLAGDRCLMTQRAAQLAHDPPAALVVQVDMLACQRRAPAVRAAIAVGLQCTDPAAQQAALQLLDVGHRESHDRRTSPPAPALLRSSIRWQRVCNEITRVDTNVSILGDAASSPLRKMRESGLCRNGQLVMIATSFPST